MPELCKQIDDIRMHWTNIHLKSKLSLSNFLLLLVWCGYFVVYGRDLAIWNGTSWQFMQHKCWIATVNDDFGNNQATLLRRFEFMFRNNDMHNIIVRVKWVHVRSTKQYLAHTETLKERQN